MNTQHAHHWVTVNGALERKWVFADFEEAMKFVNAVAELANAHNHHPDIFISYKHVTLRLCTHDAKTITEKDHALAREIDGISV